MKKILLFSFVWLYAISTSAQTKKRYPVNPGEKPIDAIPKDAIYRFPAFTLADITMKSGLSVQARVNYNSLYGEMQFINARGDTLSVADENNIKWIAAGKDTFYFSEGWLERLANNNESKLARRTILAVSNKEKIGGMDIPAFGAIETNTKSTASQQTRDLVAKEKLTYTEYFTYFFADRFYHFFPASKKNLMKIYGKQQPAIEVYLKENKTDFNNEDDLKRLSVFLQGL